MRLLLAAIALLTLITGVQSWRVHSWQTKYNVLEAQYQKEKAEAKAQYEAAEKQYRSIEEANRVRLTEISHEAQAQIDKAQLDASNARKSSRRLLDAFSNSSPCTQTTPSTALASTSQAAPDLRSQLFQEINDMAGEFAEAADRNYIAGQACISAYEVAR